MTDAGDKPVGWLYELDTGDGVYAATMHHVHPDEWLKENRPNWHYRNIQPLYTRPFIVSGGQSNFYKDRHEVIHLEDNATAVSEALVEAANFLEVEMRRYVYDRGAERRIAILEAYRNKLGVQPWDGEAALSQPTRTDAQDDHVANFAPPRITGLPDKCRTRLRIEGKPYPKSGCEVCGSRLNGFCPEPTDAQASTGELVAELERLFEKRSHVSYNGNSELTARARQVAQVDSQIGEFVARNADRILSALRNHEGPRTEADIVASVVSEWRAEYMELRSYGGGRLPREAALAAKIEAGEEIIRALKQKDTDA